MVGQGVPVVVFDGDCGFCARCVAWAQRWVRPGVLFQAWQHADLIAMGLTEDACRQALQFVGPDGQAESGGRAVCRVLGEGCWPWPVMGRAGSLPIVRRAVDAAYATVARARHRLPGSTAACALPAEGATGIAHR